MSNLAGCESAMPRDDLVQRGHDVAQICNNVIERLNQAEHRNSCGNCEDGYCFDCVLLEMTDAEFAVDSAFVALARSQMP